MTDYREYIFHRCDITDLGNKEEATRLAQFLANECLELHRLVTKQEEAMKERLSAKDYEEMSKRVAKELIRELGNSEEYKDIPLIVARGRKGGSNIAAAIVNALLYGM